MHVTNLFQRDKFQIFDQELSPTVICPHYRLPLTDYCLPIHLASQTGALIPFKSHTIFPARTRKFGFKLLCSF